MESLKIVAWIDFNNEYPTKILNRENIQEVIDLIKQDIIDNDYMFSGEEHQNALTGAPLFSDGTCFRASMRCFGSIMATALQEKTGEEYSYMDFYMTLSDSRLPKEVEYDVKPNDEVPPAIGLTIKQDQDLVIESLSMGMPLMTTDVVVRQLYDYLKIQLEEQLDEDLENAEEEE